MASLNREFWEKEPGLAWSNSEADDTIRIRAALLRPRFGRLLEIALVFGIEHLQTEWTTLLSEPTDDMRRARASVERILAHIEKGFARAAA